jgi:hypothetical protein
MTPLILSSLAKSSRLMGTQEVAAEVISENKPLHQRSPYNGAIWPIEVTEDI